MTPVAPIGKGNSLIYVARPFQGTFSQCQVLEKRAGISTQTPIKSNNNRTMEIVTPWLPEFLQVFEVKIWFVGRFSARTPWHYCNDSPTFLLAVLCFTVRRHREFCAVLELHAPKPRKCPKKRNGTGWAQRAGSKNTRKTQLLGRANFKGRKPRNFLGQWFQCGLTIKSTTVYICNWYNRYN